MKNDVVAALSAICLVFCAAGTTQAFVTSIISPRPSASEPSSRLTPNGRRASVDGSLFAKKKKAAAAGKGGKIQVKLLKYVAGTGQVGDVIKVAPAFFENKLKRTQSAVLITDDEVAKQNEEQAKGAKEALDSATEMKEKIEGMTLTFPMKAGPNGHLFGGVQYKAILTELTKQFPKGAIGKGVKVEAVKDAEGNDVPHDDIKELGDFKATVSLLKDVVSADLTVSVVEKK